MTCTATLTTQTVTDRTVAHMPRDGVGTTPLYDNLIPDGVTVQRQGDRLVRVDLHTLTCDNGPRHHDESHRHWLDDEEWMAEWDDGTPGASPHVDRCRICKAECDMEHERGSDCMDCHNCGGWPPPDPDPCPDCGTRPEGHPLHRMTGHPLGCTIQHGCMCGSTAPTVTDAEMREAWKAMEAMDSLLDLEGPLSTTKERALRVVLEAAARARQENT